MTNPAAPDLGLMYRGARERLTALVTAPEVDLERLVPASPAWRVHDVISHLSGITVDAMTGNMDGAPGEAWTDAQVTRGRNRSVAELLGDWAEYGPKLEELLSSPMGAAAGNAVMDVHAHEADLRDALGLPFGIDGEFLAWAGSRVRDSFHSAVAEAGLPPVSLTLTDAEWFRARLGRRSESQVRAYDWSADATPYLDAFFLFGPADKPLAENQ